MSELRRDPTSSGNGYATPPLAVQANLGQLVDGYALGGWSAGELKPLDVARALRRAGIAPDEFHAAIQFAADGDTPEPYVVWRDAATGEVCVARRQDYDAGLVRVDGTPNGAVPDAELVRAAEAAGANGRRRGDAGLVIPGNPINGEPMPPIPGHRDGVPADAVPVRQLADEAADTVPPTAPAAPPEPSAEAPTTPPAPPPPPGT